MRKNQANSTVQLLILIILLDRQAYLPEISLFQSAQVFMVFGMYNFGAILTLGVVSQELKWTFRCMRFHCPTVELA